MAGDPTQVKRTREIEEFTNLYFIHPISRALVTVFAKLGVHPNVVSLGGILFGAFAAVAYFHYDRWEMALAGFLLMIGWHVMDGADGQLARLTGKTSEMGKALDGLVDHLSFAMVYVGLAVASALIFGNWIWWLAVAAGISHVVQASTYEFQRQMYDYWAMGKESARPVMPEEFRAGMRSKGGLGGFLNATLLAYLRIQHRVTGADPRLVARLEGMKEAGDGAEVNEAFASANLGAVKAWSLLCSNYRTVAIFVACIAANPLYFFLFEIIVLNIALVLLRLMQARRNEQLFARLIQGNSLCSQDAVAMV